MPESKESFADLFLGTARRSIERAEEPRTAVLEKPRQGTRAGDQHLASMRKPVADQPETIVITDITALNKAVEPLRLAAQLERKDLARLLGVSPQYLSQLEQGKRGIMPESIVRFAEAVGYRMEIRFVKVQAKANKAQSKGRSKK